MINFIKSKLNRYREVLASDQGSDSLTFIGPEPGWKMRDFTELIEYRDLFFFLTWRDIKVMYAQTILGFSWAILRPLIQIVIFSVIFGKIAKVPTEGVPYFLFSSIAIIPWTYMSQTMTESSDCLIHGAGMIGKVYIPRLIFPFAPLVSRLVDFGISMIIVLCAMLYFQVLPTWNLFLFPLFVFLMMFVPAGVGLWLSSLTVRFRDVKFAMPFMIQMLMYSAPIVYSASTIPEKYRMLYSLNPIVGVIEGFRACMLGTSVPWEYVLPGVITAFILIVTGAMYFKRMEKIIVDVI